MSRSLSSAPTLTDRIAADLRAHAVAGLSLPAPLTLAGLAAHYGVSLTPIRHAVAALVEEGVLQRELDSRLMVAPGLERESISCSAALVSDADTDWEQRLTEEVVARSLRGDAGYLREEAVAGRYGVGRTVLRQAFSRMAGRGLLEHVPRCGWRVREFDERDMGAYLEVRETLELTALDLALPHLVSADLEEMLAGNAAGGRLDNRLHAYLVEKSGNPYLRDFFAQHGVYYTFLFDYAAPEADFQEEAAAQHREILTALLRGDETAARAALSRHIRAQRPVVRRLMAALQPRAESP